MSEKNPTNHDLMKEIRNINKQLEVYGHDIGELKEWKIAVEAAKKALTEYQVEHPEINPNSINGKAWAAVLAALAALTAVILARLK